MFWSLDVWGNAQKACCELQSWEGKNHCLEHGQVLMVVIQV